MANTNRAIEGTESTEIVAWTQPTRYISVPVGKNSRGHFVEVPKVDWLSTVAEAHGTGAANVALDALADYMASEAKAAANAKAVVDKNDADAEREVINGVVTKIANGTYDSGDISGRDDFNRALLAEARDTLRGALVSRGEASPSDTRIAEAFKANYPRAMERFGATVAARGYVPSTKTKGEKTATGKPVIAGLEF